MWFQFFREVDAPFLFFIFHVRFSFESSFVLSFHFDSRKLPLFNDAAQYFRCDSGPRERFQCIDFDFFHWPLWLHSMCLLNIRFPFMFWIAFKIIPSNYILLFVWMKEWKEHTHTPKEREWESNEQMHKSQVNKIN